MDYEKKYKEALERAREELGSGCFDRGTVEYIFPELKESEDEKTRKSLLSFLHGLGEFEYPDTKTYISWLNWLEKQGDKDKLIQELGKYKVKYTQEVLSQQLEKQSEHRTDDKIESKFKVGDWVYHEKSGNACHINKIENGLYVSDEGATISLGRQNDWRLWTIQDAKDGDVLALDWHEGEDCWGKIIIFKKYHENGVERLFYGPCVEGYGITIKNRELAWNDENVPYYSQTWTSILKPTTKEQRDLLFTKLKEAGYEWDAEKKKLRKIE